MSLHGEIKVNQRVIGDWNARRKARTPQEVNTYEVRASWLHDGIVREAETEMEHTFSDGAWVLAAKVITWAVSVGAR